MKKLIHFLRDITPFKKYLFLLIKHLGKPSPSIYQHLYFNGIFKVNVEDKYFYMRHNETGIENITFWEGIENGWEKVSMKLWIELCKDATCIVDVGAHIGLYTLVAKTINENATVHSFEPIERIYNKLTENLELNNFQVHHARIALSDKDGVAYINDTDGEALSLDCSLNYNEESSNSGLIQIQTNKLSTIIEKQNMQRIDVMKIDVEGHEVQLLDGMGNYLKSYKPTMIIEIVDENNGKQIFEMIKDCNYLFFNIDEIHPPRLVKEITKSDKYNFLLCNENVAKKLNLI